MNDVCLYFQRLIFTALGILCLVSIGTQSMAKQPLFDAFKRNIVIDPGHGGQEAGSRGSDGTLEKAVVLRLAQIIAAELERDYKVTLTRTGDYQIDIVSRAALANHLKADLFLSIHTGGSFLHSTTGTTIYYHQRESYPPTPSVQNSDAQKDNKNSPILWHRVQERYKEKSRALALILSKRLSNLKTVKSSRIQGVPLALLQSIDMPAVMIEIGYLTNPIDEKNLQKERVLMDMAVEISNGIEDFFAQEQQ